MSRKQTFEAVRTLTMTAGENLNGDDGRLVKIDTDGKVIKSVAAGDFSTGVVAMDPTPSQGSSDSSEDNAVRVAMLEGIIICEAGAAITQGHLLHSDASGRVISAGGDAPADATAGDFIIGQAMEAASAAGEMISVRAQPVFVGA